ncbi:ThiF family adenylyltransferase [Mycobacterium sp.]|uniref:ThiF family adenylyltransferase n=1 Tax=Mycobacterium sp. TaxID=1785 RepID=UPI003D117E58
MSGEVADQACQHLLRDDGQEDVLLATCTISTGAGRTTMLIHTLVHPEHGDRTVHGNASFSGRYILRAAAQAAQHGHGLVMMHSHPDGWGWQALSRTDHDTEHETARIAFEYTGLALTGMTLAGDGTWSARLWPHTSTRPRWAETVRVVGPKLEVSFNERLRPPPPPSESEARRIAAWGPKTQADIARMRVLVVGVGSVGLDVALRLAAAGIINIGVMDPDVVEKINLDRMVGATRADARRRRPKVDVAVREMLRAATAEHPQFERFPINVCTKEGFHRALDYDVIICCVDRPWPRAVLNSVAYADLIPVIDGGLAIQTFDDGTMRSGSWRAHTLVPQRPCLLCSGQLNPTDLQLDLQGKLDDPAYIEQSGRQPIAGLPNVALYSASVSAALLAQFASVTAHPGREGVPYPLRYQLAVHTLDRPSTVSGAHCPYEGQTAAGDRRIALAPAPSQAGQLLRYARISRSIAASLRAVADWLA